MHCKADHFSSRFFNSPTASLKAIGKAVNLAALLIGRTKQVTRTSSNPRICKTLATKFTLALVVTTLAACGGGSGESDATGGTGSPVDTGGTVNTTPPSNSGFDPTGDFEIRSIGPGLVLLEGNQDGLRIPLSLDRQNGHNNPVTLDIVGESDADVAFVTSSFSRLQLTPNEDSSEAILKLAISDLPISSQQRDFIIIATDGTDTDRIAISVEVQPTTAPDVYLLAGQSNMVGFSGDGTRESFVGGADEPNPRIWQLNVTENRDDDFVLDTDFTSEDNIAETPTILQALDPLHLPFDSEGGKSQDYIGLGLSFARSALANTSADIVLVPAAWAGSSFCDNSNGPNGNWVSSPSDNPDLGNTLMFDRAVARSNLAIRESGGVLRGILWHQGESDANERCAPVYAENMVNLVDQFRAQLDYVGNDSLNRIPDTNIPFVVGSMSRGEDEREDLSTFLPSKQMIDDAHFNFPTTVDHGAVSDHSDLVPPQYPCGNTSCIHFGPGALRTAGDRYYQALLRAIQ